MEYLVHVSNYREVEETKQILKQFLLKKDAADFEKFYCRKMIRQILEGRNFETDLHYLGELQLNTWLKNNSTPIIYLVKKTTGIYRTVKELSFEIEIKQNNILEKFDVLRRIVSFATDYNQDSFIESELLTEEGIEPETELGIKDRFLYEISPFLALQLSGRLTLNEVLDILFQAGFDGCTYFYDILSDLHVVLVYYLSDYRSEDETFETGLNNFLDKSLTLINSNESKRLFKSYQAGFRKIRLAQNGRGNPEEGYEGFIQTLYLEEESIRNNK